MPDIKGTTEFLAADLPLYETVKPYWAVLGPGETLGPDIPFNNMEWETRELSLTDIRSRLSDFTLSTAGFEILKEDTQSLDLSSAENCISYRGGTERVLKDFFDAEYVLCYDLGKRANVRPKAMTRDVHDILSEQGPALGLHNDVTFNSGPELLVRYLPEEMKAKYLQKGYRFRIINTWRSLNPVCEDRPLIFCDFRTVDFDDLIPADRILPDRAGEIYHIRYQKSQRWCWLEHQTPDELILMAQYDSHPGDAASLCPHGNFVNTRASKDAPPRRSVETRSIVITKL